MNIFRNGKRKMEKTFNKFMVIWVGQLISSIGSGLTAFALGVYVYQLTGTATSVSLVTLCAFLPTVVLSPFGGVLADRFDRRLMMILGDLFSAVGLIYLLVVIFLGQVILWQVCLAVSISAVFVALMEPAYKATVTDLLTPEEYAKASGLVQLAGSARYLLSPIIAGALLGVVNIEVILSIDICTFFITVGASLWVSRALKGSVQKPQQAENFITAMKEGIVTITANKGILTLICLISVVTFFFGILQTLLTPLLLTLTTASVLGMVMTLSSCGMLVGSLVIGVVKIRGSYTNMIAYALAGAGFFFALIGSSTNVVFITVTGFLFLLSTPFINTGADVLIRKNIPAEKQGRAWGLIGVISQIGYIVAYAISGVLADHVFTPWMMPDGALANTVGRLVGTGESRGMGLMFMISGLLVLVLSALIYNSRATRALEESRTVMIGNEVKEGN